MSRSHAESHRRIKLIAAEIDRTITKLRSLDENDEARLMSEVLTTAASARRQPELLDWAAFLEGHAHVIARGGALSLLQSAVGLASASLVTLAAEEWALGRSWKVNWLRRTQRPHEWTPGALLRTIDLGGPRTTWVLQGGRLVGPTVGGSGLRVQQVADGQLVAETAAERRGVEVLRGLPTGGLLVGGDDGSVQHWTLDPLAMQARSAGHGGAVTVLDVSADGQHALSLGADGGMIFWSVAPLKKLATLTAPGRPPRVMTLSPGGSYAITGHSDGRVELVMTGDKGKAKTLLGHASPIERLLVRKGMLLSSDHRGEIRQWAMPSGELVRELRGHRAPVNFLWVDAEGQRMLSSASDGSVRLWSLETGESVLSLSGVGDGVMSASALVEGKLALGLVDGTVRVLDLATGALTTVGSHDGPVTMVAPFDDNALLSAGLDRSARLWLLDDKATTPTQRSVLGLDADGLRALCVTPNHEVEVVDFSEGRRLRRVAVDALTTAHPLLEHGRILLDTRREPLPLFGSAPAAQRIHTLRVTDVESGQALLTLEGHRLGVRAALIDDKERWLATGSADGEVKLWDLATGNSLQSLRGHDAPVVALAFEPEGIELYALYEGNEVCTWSTRSGKLLRRIPVQHAPERPLTLLRAAGERELLMAGPGGEIGRWEAETGKRTKGWRAHPGEVRALAVDLDGELLATGGDDRRVHLWKRSSGKLLARYDLPSMIAGCRFLPDGRLAAWGERGEPHYLKFVDWAQDD